MQFYSVEEVLNSIKETWRKNDECDCQTIIKAVQD